MKKIHTQITTTRIIMSGFALGVVIGTLLLYLPIAHNGDLPLIDIFFMATSAVCVTGLSTFNIGVTLTWFGQAVLFLLIEIGGLGVITFTVLLMIFFGQKISLSSRLLIQNAYNTDTMTGLILLTKRIVKTSLIIQVIGAIGYSLVFVPEYGALGIWYSIFHSVSAFCNAGIDILGGNSLTQYTGNVIINLVTIALIVVGGIGFPVYWEIGSFFRRRKNKINKKFSLRFKIAIASTVFFILFGALLTILFEWDNPQTLGTLSVGDKIMAAVFQSVTLRTAGFATIDQAGFRPASCLIYLFLMLIGGSPGGTAGGIKTVTIVILVATMIANIKGSKDVNIFRRKIEDEYIRSCSAIASFSLLSLLILTAALMYVQNYTFVDTLYEMTSAIGTVGLSRGLTGNLSVAGKLIVILTMYLGRIGPITIALSFSYRKKKEVGFAGDKLTLG